MIANLANLRLLNDGYRRISKGFCKHALGYNVDGNVVVRTNDECISYCSIGAIIFGENYSNSSFIICTSYLKKFIPADIEYKDCYGQVCIVKYNNHPDTTQEDIKNLFKKAINQLESDLGLIELWEVEVQAQLFDLVGERGVCV